jgi:hypothetical protein
MFSMYLFICSFVFHFFPRSFDAIVIPSRHSTFEL